MRWAARKRPGNVFTSLAGAGSGWERKMPDPRHKEEGRGAEKKKTLIRVKEKEEGGKNKKSEYGTRESGERFL